MNPSTRTTIQSKSWFVGWVFDFDFLFSPSQFRFFFFFLFFGFKNDTSHYKTNSYLFPFSFHGFFTFHPNDPHHLHLINTHLIIEYKPNIINQKIKKLIIDFIFIHLYFNVHFCFFEGLKKILIFPIWEFFFFFSKKIFFFFFQKNFLFYYNIIHI